MNLQEILRKNKMTPKQIESYKKWYDKTVRKCKTCGSVCILLPESQEGESR